MRLRVLWVSLVCLGLWLGAWSCAPSHCGYNNGDATCAGRDPNKPYCNLCIEENDGCVASPPADAGCVLITDTAGFDSLNPTTVPATEGSTSNPDPDPDPTTTADPGPSPGTTDPTFPQTTTTTTPTTVDPSTSSETTLVTSDPSTSSSESTVGETTTSGSTGTSTTSDDTTSGSSSTTSDDTTGMPPPMCGNDVVEAMELCDGMDLAGKKCTDFAGKGGGTLMCTAMCQYNLAGCCLANNQPCANAGQCCINSCKFDILMGKNVCKP